MFTEQIVQLNALRGKVPDEWLDAFQSVLGQCAAHLTHRGPVEIDVHPDRLRNAPCHNVSDGDVAAALTVKAYGASYTRDPNQTGEGTLCGPAAIYTVGPIVAIPNDDNFSFIGKCADVECVYGDNADFIDIDVDNLVVNQFLDAKTARWAVCKTNWKYAVNYPSKNGGTAWVTVQECDDAAGTNPAGAQFDVWLPVASGQDPNVVEDQVIAIQKSADGWICESAGDDAIGKVKYWSGGDAPGAKDEVLPGWRAVKRMPAVDVQPTRSGTVWSLHPDYELTWPAAMDQLALLFSYGGTEVHTHDPHQPGDEAGSFIDDHTVADYTEVGYTGISVDPHDSFYTDEAETGVTIDDHADHFHYFASNTFVEYGSDLEVGQKASPVDTTGPVDSSGNSVTLSHTVTDSYHDHFVSYYLGHEVNDPGHRHYFTYLLEHSFSLGHDSAEHKPPYVALWLIERVNNGVAGGAMGGGGP